MRKSLLAVCAALTLTAPAAASGNSRATAVLQTEARWVRAIDTRDAATLAQILAPNFVHVNYRGALQNGDAALAAVKQPKPYKQNLSGETVDFAGNVAIVRGTNTITQGAHVVLRLRFTDVFVNEDGRWMAVSAQETAIGPAASCCGPRR